MGKKRDSFKMKTDSRFFFYLLMLLILISTVCFALLPYRDMRFNNEKCQLLEKDWRYVNARGQEEAVSLPFDLEANIENGIVVSRILPAEHEYDANMVALWASMQYVKAYLGDELIYSYTDEQRPQPSFGKTEGSCWHIIRLPGEWEGKEFRLELVSAYPYYVGNIKSIYLGTKASFLFRIIHNYGMEFLFAIAMIVAGSLFLAIHIIMKNSFHKNRGLSYLGWFQLWGGIWMLMECGLTQFISGNELLMHMLSFISLMVLPVPMLLYLEGLEGIHTRKLLKLFALLQMADVVGTTALQFLGIRDYYETLSVSHVLLIMTVLLLMGTIVVEKLVYHNKDMKYIFFSGVVVTACSLCELISFYLGGRWHTGELFNLGMFFFMVMMGYKTLRQIYDAVMKGNEAKYYEKLATVDFMTRCQNKTAYLEFMNNSGEFVAKKQSVYVIMADLNELKQMNDSLGHHMGDEAIRLCANILKDNFGDLGECYRIGGDEFLCVCCNCEETAVKYRINIVEDICRKESTEWGHSFRIAMGYAFYDIQNDRSLEDTVRRADDSMYVQKRQMKFE